MQAVVFCATDLGVAILFVPEVLDFSIFFVYFVVGYRKSITGVPAGTKLFSNINVVAG